MKTKKKLIHRLAAFGCALIVAASCLFGSVPYYAYTYGTDVEAKPVFETFGRNVLVEPLFEYESYVDWDLESYPYYIVINYSLNGESHTHIMYSNTPIYVAIKKVSSYYRGHFADEGTGGMVCIGAKKCSQGTPGICDFKLDGSIYTTSGHANSYLVYSSHDIVYSDDSIFYSASSNESGGSYNSNLGYLQNIKRKSTYVRGALYNYNEESLTYHFYHDTTSTTGVDLTSGNYSIRHYVSMATVRGYEKEDIVEMTDKYLMAEYDASQGYFSYLDKDYDDKLIDLGFEGFGALQTFLDTISGKFLLQHHYLQIVNNDTGEVGGYVHLYPKDTTGDFGVELNHEGLDENFEVDKDAPSGVVDDSTGSGLTHEEALENADQPKLDDLEGVESFTNTLNSFSSSLGNVPLAIKSVLELFPWWVLALLGLSFALTFLAVMLKFGRG